MLMESRLVGQRVVHLGCRVVQLLNPFEPQTATLGLLPRSQEAVARFPAHSKQPRGELSNRLG